jgi:riboflavin transporter FmnP
MRALFKAFFAGLIAMFVCNQGLLWILDRLDFAETNFWNMDDPFGMGVSVLGWLCIWGALWGLVLWLLIRNAEAAGYYIGALILAAVLMTAVALAIAPWLGVPLFGVSLPSLAVDAVVALVIANAAYGLGFAILMRLFHPPR